MTNMSNPYQGPPFPKVPDQEVRNIGVLYTFEFYLETLKQTNAKYKLETVLNKSVKYSLQVKILGKIPKISQKLLIPNMWCSQLPEYVPKIMPKIYK